MKQLTCEMCGSTDLMKDGGVFVCQSCGCKYSVEEAKKMMVEGTVDVQGTVKVDNTEFVQKYLDNARRAKEKEDWEETEKYYNMVEQNDPSNIEAIFYSSYGKAKSTLIEADFYKREAAFKVLQNCVSIIDDNYKIEDEEENKIALEQISTDILLMACSQYVYTQRKNGYGMVVSSDKMKTVTLFNNLGNEFMIACEHIAQKYPDENKGKRVYFYRLALKHAEFTLKNGHLAKPDSYRKLVKTYKQWIEEITAECGEKAKEEYWAEHAEEKAKLEAEKTELQATLAALDAETGNLSGMSDKKYFEEQIEGLKSAKAALGLFDGKAKKAKQAEIDAFQAKLDKINASLKDPLADIKKRRDSATARIAAIDEEFNKSRM